MDSYDLVIIGSGPGGYVCAIRAAQLGLKTALVEKHATLGGTCLNVGCIPSKALLESSDLFAAANHRFADHGIALSAVGLELGRMMERKSQIVKELVDGVAMLMKKNKVTVLTGHGEVTAPGQVTVRGEAGEQQVQATSICLAMGSVPVELPFMPFDGERVVSSTEALSFAEVPERLVVVGAGAVGLELGSVWSRLGAKVTVVEMLPTIAPFADKQMSGSLQRALEAQGLEFRLSTKVTAAKVTKKGVTLTVANDKGETEELSCDRVLVAVGRRPNSSGSGLENAGVELEAGGRVKIDDHFRTNVPGVYAIGDLVRGPMLAHKAEEEGIACVEHLITGHGHIDYDAVPAVVYTHPEIASVGLTEAQARERFGADQVQVVEYNLGGNGKSQILRTQGF
ncbi:MAG TPA: dihydrolipoyl dehydrogenase, partial [Thermoanaerobaculales bacterium]|nr:dihydrolipoyl dehydrogenase [Thermoanaerobaculales bacterium]